MSRCVKLESELDKLNSLCKNWEHFTLKAATSQIIAEDRDQEIPRRRAEALEKCRIDFENRTGTSSFIIESEDGFDEIDSGAIRVISSFSE